MKPTICNRCKKNVAVIFITKVENGKSTNEGLCLKCAKDLGLKENAASVRLGRLRMQLREHLIKEGYANE